MLFATYCLWQLGLARKNADKWFNSSSRWPTPRCSTFFLLKTTCHKNCMKKPEPFFILVFKVCSAVPSKHSKQCISHQPSFCFCQVLQESVFLTSSLSMIFCRSQNPNLPLPKELGPAAVGVSLHTERIQKCQHWPYIKADAHSFAREEYESLISQGFLNQTHAFEYVTACGKSYMTIKENCNSHIWQHMSS